MVFMAVPADMKDNGEEWFVSQINQLTKARTEDEGLPKEFPEKPSAEFQKAMDEFVEEWDAETGFELKIQKPRRPVLREHEFKWFEPIVLNWVVRSHRTPEARLGGYSICFEADDAEQTAHFIFDVVLVSDEIDDDATDGSVLKKEHLTPLEINLARSISSATKVLNEMRYMESRETRMRHTSDSINTRVRYFSYASILILFGVTGIQVTYLKKYFKKKKIL